MRSARFYFLILYQKIQKEFRVDAIGEAVIKVQLSDLEEALDLEDEIDQNVDVNYQDKEK